MCPASVQRISAKREARLAVASGRCLRAFPCQLSIGRRLVRNRALPLTLRTVRCSARRIASSAGAQRAMKPRPIVQIQAGIAVATSIVVIALACRTGALGVLVASGLGWIVSMGLAIRYDRHVRVRNISGHRVERDRIMKACLMVGLGVPTVLAVAVLTAIPPGWHAPASGVPAHVAVIAANAVFAAMLTSSCFDWYLIRPFRDGVLGPPACQMDEHDKETALYYAQAWIAHRTMAEIIGWGGSAIVLVVSLVALQQSTHNPTWSGFFTYLAPAGAVYLGIGGFLAKRLRPVPQYVQQPSPGLGRWAHGTIIDAAENEQEIEGFVVDVSLGVGLQLLKEADGEVVQVPLDQSAKLRATTRMLCISRCERWIPQCEHGLLEDEAAAQAKARGDADGPAAPVAEKTPRDDPTTTASRPN
jgi:hypothetical protein